jgi:hypothetical protein
VANGPSADAADRVEWPKWLTWRKPVTLKRRRRWSTQFMRACNQGNVLPCIKPSTGLQATLDFNEFGSFRAPSGGHRQPGH